MGRKRQSDNHLPPRVYRHRGGYRYVPKVGNPVPLGNDLAEALRKYAMQVQSETCAEDGTVGWLIDWYLANIGTVAPRNAPRTISDKADHAIKLKKELGHFPLRLLRPYHVREYLDLGVLEKRAVRANREKALLSHACTVAVGKGWIEVNPCLKVTRNFETPRERYIEDAEMNSVLVHCSLQVQAVALLIYRTLQRPGDILRWSRKNLIERDNFKVLHFIQSKTRAVMDIAISSDMARIFADLESEGAAKVAKRKTVLIHEPMTLIYNRSRKPFTEAGISGMFRKACVIAGVKDFAIYDLKGKGATDMYRDGQRLSVICALCGHDSEATTERYIKARLHEVVQPNMRRILPTG